MPGNPAIRLSAVIAPSAGMLKSMIRSTWNGRLFVLSSRYRMCPELAFDPNRLLSIWNSYPTLTSWLPPRSGT